MNFGEDLFKEHDRYKSKYGIDKIWYEQWGNHEYNSRSNGRRRDEEMD